METRRQRDKETSRHGDEETNGFEEEPSALHAPNGASELPARVGVCGGVMPGPSLPWDLETGKDTGMRSVFAYGRAAGRIALLAAFGLVVLLSAGLARSAQDPKDAP